MPSYVNSPAIALKWPHVFRELRPPRPAALMLTKIHSHIYVSLYSAHTLNIIGMT